MSRLKNSAVDGWPTFSMANSGAELQLSSRKDHAILKLVKSSIKSKILEYIPNRWNHLLKCRASIDSLKA